MMTFIWTIQNKLKSLGFVIICMMLSSYFLFYAIKGERGVIKYFYLKQEIAAAEKIAAKYKDQKNHLEMQVKRLSSSSLDLDLLEERARVVLNFVGDDEFIIIDGTDS